MPAMLRMQSAAEKGFLRAFVKVDPNKLGRQHHNMGESANMGKYFVHGFRPTESRGRTMGRLHFKSKADTELKSRLWYSSTAAPG